jgi:hypothetical protein
VAGLLDQIAGLADTPQKRAALAALVGELERNPAHPPERFNRGVRNVAGGMAKAIGEGIAFPRKYMDTYQPGSMAADNPAATEWAAGTAMNMVGAPALTGGIPAGALGSAAAKFIPVRGPVKSEPGYVYHATNSERAREIAETGSLKTHRPHEFTDQDVWPDGSTQKRNYFTGSADNTWQFAPEDGTPVLLRAKADPQIRRESTGDLYSTKPFPADKLEAYTNEGWIPLKNNGDPILGSILAALLGLPALANAPRLEQAQ